jgi:spore coat polysaccharide biosynthesis protein SpsF
VSCICLIQARYSATRFPGKILQRIDKENTILELIVKRILLSTRITPGNIFVLTSTNNTDDIVENYLNSKKINFYRGDELNVFKRFHDFLKLNEFKWDIILRVCADNPFIEPAFIDALIDEADKPVNRGYDYFSYADKSGTPSVLTHYGFFSELIRTDSFKRAASLNLTPYEQEHVTPVFYKNPSFKAFWLPVPADLQEMKIRCTVDTSDDLSLLTVIREEVGNIDFTWSDIIHAIRQKPWIQERMERLIELNSKR